MLHYEQMVSLLTRIFGKEKDMVGLELGTNTGTMERTLLDAFPNLIMFGVDIYDHHLDDWKEPRLKFICASTDDAAKLFTLKQFDFIYIDAEHTYVQALKDILNYAKFLKEDGILAGHDYVVEPKNVHEGVRFAVDDLFKQQNVHFGEDLVWWIYRKDIKWL